MSNALVPTDATAELTARNAELQNMADRNTELRKKARSERTVAEYSADMALFEDFCARYGFDPLPAAPEVVSLFVSEGTAGGTLATVRRRLASLSVIHRDGGYESPTGSPLVRDAVAGLRRDLANEADAGGRELVKQAPAIDRDQLADMVATLDLSTAKGLRDRAILTVGFACALRRSELASLRVDHLTFTDSGLVIRREAGKTGATIREARKGTSSVDPVTALQEWLELAGITEGPMFRRVFKGGKVGDKALSGRAVRDIVAAAGLAAGLGNLSGHSLRRGFATTAHRAGADLHTIATAGGWQPNSPVLSGYIESARDASGAPDLGL